MRDMAYLESLGLKHHPFPVAPDDENFYVSSYFEQVIAEIVHGIMARKGFMVISGDVGVGKTTITRRVLSILAKKEVATSLVFHTALKDVDLLREINRDFGLLPGDGDGHLQLGDHLRRLNDFLVSRFKAGKNCAIIIDDAQNLDRDSLELVRMISNLETDQQKLVQILLVGQTELMTGLKAHALRQLHSRIVIRKIVRSLSRQEMRNYILFKLNSAGSSGRLMVTPAAFWRLYRRTGGNLRRLNLLMDRVLYALSHRKTRVVDYHIVGLADADLYPERIRMQKRFRAIAFSILLPLLVAVGSWGLHLGTSRNVMAVGTDGSALRYKIPLALGQIDSTQQPEPMGVPHPDLKKNPQSSIDPAVAAFLSIRQLDRYSAAFQLALKEGDLDLLSRRIFRESGYQLVQLPSLPDRIRQKYGALAFTLTPGHSPVWLLFWRPQLELKRFYYQYQGDEIRRLQTMFAGLKLYRHRIDGIVGGQVMRAVVDFQRISALPVTGFPDAATLFLLCQYQEEKALWPKA